MFSNYENDKIFKTLIDILRWEKKDHYNRFCRFVRYIDRIEIEGHINQSEDTQKIWSLSQSDIDKSPFVRDHPALNYNLKLESGGLGNILVCISMVAKPTPFQSKKRLGSLKSAMKVLHDELRFF